MSGFSSILGYVFIFFCLVGSFIVGILLYTQQIEVAQILVENQADKNYISSNFDLSFNSPYNVSGKIYFELENNGPDVVLYKDDNYCYDFYIDDKYISKDDIEIHLEDSLGDYYSVESNSKVIFSVGNQDVKNNSIIKFISCEGIQEVFAINVDELEYWDEEWLNRKNIQISNPSDYPMEEYQILVELNESNFNFSNPLDELRFILPIKENLVIDSNFDTYNQQINEYSNFNNQILLGSTTGSEASDPTQIEGKLSNALEFDGNDFLTISADESLEIPREFSFTSWIKWNGLGDTSQYLFYNGDNANSVSIVNDGGVNDKKIKFDLNINGNLRTLYSTQTIDDDWNFIVCTYNGEDMKIYINNVLDNQIKYIGDIRTYSNNNYIGSDSSSNFYSGIIDELKIYNIALEKEEIDNLYYDNLKFRILDYYIIQEDLINNVSKIYVKIPYIDEGSEIKVDMYYDKENFNLEGSLSSIENTFSYNSPNVVSYLTSDRMASTTGLNIMSLTDNNIIIVGSNVYYYNKTNRTTLGTASLSIDDEIRMKSLAQVEGDGQTDDVLTPMSWAGKEFYYRGFRNGNDEFCMFSPFGTANVEIRDSGSLEWSGTVDDSGNCITNDISTNNALGLISDLPILVHYQGGGSQDSFPFFPATDDNLYGSPSQTMYVGSGSSGARVNWQTSDGQSGVQNLGAYGTFNDGGNGADGNTPAFLLKPNNLIGAIQEADNDGSEATIFVTKYEFGTLFGSNEETDYISVVSNVEDANCTSYTSSGVVIDNVPTGTGLDGIYKYNFGVGNDNSYANSGWTLECDKPVWAYYENHADNDDETNMWSYLQMRQYVYPEPVVVVE